MNKRLAVAAVALAAASIVACRGKPTATPNIVPPPAPTSTPTATFRAPTSTPAPPPSPFPTATALPTNTHGATPTPSPSGISRNAPGFPGKTWLESYYHVVSAYFDGITARVVSTENGLLIDVPWQSRSDVSSVDNFKVFDRIQKPTLEQHVIVSDELSELCRIVSLADNAERMRACYNTIKAMRGDFGSLPGWVAEWSSGKVKPISNDPASDATARIYLSLAFGAFNGNFPGSDRKNYRALADEIMRDHLNHEYASVMFTGSLTGKTHTLLLAGGGNTAKAGIEAEIWAGYYPDVIEALAIAYHLTGDEEIKNRALMVTEQALMAAQWNGKDFSIPTMSNRWKFQGGTLIPVPSNPYHADKKNPTWDDADGPRFLGMGNALRMLELAGIQGREVELLREYVRQLIAHENDKLKGCIQYKDTETEPPKCVWFDDSFYGHGLTALLTIGERSLAGEKVKEGYMQYDPAALSGTAPGRFFAHQGRGVYREVRLHIALASFLGLDEAAFSK